MKPMTMNPEALLAHPAVEEMTEMPGREMRLRRQYRPPACPVFDGGPTCLATEPDYVFTIDREARRRLPGIIGNQVQRVILPGEAAGKADGAATGKECWEKLRHIGVVFSGGPAPGGHNVIAGIFDAAMRANPENRVSGFLVGPDGIIEGNIMPLDAETVGRFRNLGGFTMIRTGRTKIDTDEKMRMSRETCRKLGLDALVVIGGDDSNTNAAFLAQEMIADGIQVIGVPKTIDGDIQVSDDNGRTLCAVSFGFHSAARAFAQSVSSLSTDCSSDIKYWHFCKVMGRVASHLALEVGLQAHPNMVFVGEELADYVDEARMKKADSTGITDYTAIGMTLRGLSRRICDGIVRRAAAGKNYGIVVIPEGVLEFINEIQTIIIKLNSIIAEYNAVHDGNFHIDLPRLEDKLEYLRKISQQARFEDVISVWNTRDDDVFRDIPAFFQEGLLMERDSHGNFPFSQVKTEDVLLGLVTEYLNLLRDRGEYKLGIAPDWYADTMESAGLSPGSYGPVLFRNYGGDGHLLVKNTIISVRTLARALAGAGLLREGDEVPAALMKVYQKSVPDLKTQTHFFGYDGRGADPTRFDCDYTYNLGLTVFSLIAGGATGQMAAIRNLEHGFSRWEPIGIPIAPLMHLEERKGKLNLVIERSLVELDSPAFLVYQAKREAWLAAEGGDHEKYRRPSVSRLDAESEAELPMTLALNALGCPA
ncbi:MAG: phosphofructokinase [Desulfobacterales bacterium]|nr:MAG: phosphofructokinase [Desulfobacterales bacterium]